MRIDDDPQLMVEPGEWRYAPVAVALHWLLALLIVSTAALGWYMTSIEDDPGAERWFDLHKSVGIVIFVLVLARALWRLTHRPAALPASMPRWEVVASLVVQRLLYAGMVLLPITGLLGSLYTKSGVAFFGLQLPRWAAPAHDTAEAFFEVHETLVWAMAALVALHVAAGLKHALVDRDGVFQRMWFQQRKRPAGSRPRGGTV
ncbi:cytochrome b [Massilia agilis]|uniref:Cytochrome b n=1 Tax=Massilia agilis TaxID=1811226 RepID=A0ABT2DDD1_9BURK|nr:cytochrome b [Massilia agilis]MCS0808879.1 cytochrome b [Massilia agilis]